MAGFSYSFGEFNLDPGRYELRRSGQVLKLERIPMELLILLAEKQGDIVTRQEITDRLWGKDVFVDTEHGINTAIRKIRQALKDDPEEPRFLQTVTGKGYRFVAEKNKTSTSSAIVAEGKPQAANIAAAAISPSIVPAARPRGWQAAAILIVVVCLAAVGLLAANVAGIRDRVFPATRASQIHSIAVIPLANLSGDATQEYFADGMTDELITALAKNRNLRVVSRTSAMQYKGVNRPVRDIARELGVDGILEGSVERSGSRVHMTVQLIYAPTDSHVWAESYDRDLNQAYSLPEELSQTVAKEVRAATSPTPAPRYIDPEAHDAYLRGFYLWYQGDTQHSIEYFQRAIQIQPGYAAAWAGLATAYMLRPIDDECPSSEVAAKADEAVRKAVELDDSLAEAHHAMSAWYFFFAWDATRAEMESKRAVELDPTRSETHHLYSYILFALNRPDESLQEQKRAHELDPFIRNWGLGFAYIQRREFGAAINDLQLRAQALPGDSTTHFMLSYAYREKGMGPQAEQEFEKALQADGQLDQAKAVHRAFERGGEKAVEQRGVDDLKAQSRKRYISPMEYAKAYAFLGDKEETMKYLEGCYRARTPWLIMVKAEPVFDFLHSDPRYQALVKKIGLQLVP
jgi:TolB-like protein/DNA-binding winged helix-turn-helix (wHTH) protein/Flp pilus assembly protein TadD